MVKFRREWSFPCPNTFQIPPIKEFVEYYLRNSRISVDPFARNFMGCTHTNDINPNTKATYHYDAATFLNIMKEDGITADLVIFDPPYSVTQLKECYEGLGMEFTQQHAQSLGYEKERDLIHEIVKYKGVVLTFGWSSTSMGKERGYAIEEILLVSHGRRQHDTICMAARKITEQTKMF